MTTKDYVDYGPYRYWYEHKLAEDGIDICLATKDPTEYCNGLYIYSMKNPGDGMAFVVIRTNDPRYKLTKDGMLPINPIKEMTTKEEKKC